MRLLSLMQALKIHQPMPPLIPIGTPPTNAPMRGSILKAMLKSQIPIPSPKYSQLTQTYPTQNSYLVCSNVITPTRTSSVQILERPPTTSKIGVENQLRSISILGKRNEKGHKSLPQKKKDNKLGHKCAPYKKGTHSGETPPNGQRFTKLAKIQRKHLFYTGKKAKGSQV